MQNSILPLIITLVVNFSNLILSYVFVLHLQWEIRGVAFGTVIAQYLGVALALLLLFIKYRFVFIAKWEEVRGKINQWTKVLRVNYFLFIRTVCLTFAFVLFYAESSDAGAIILATNVILLQFLNWISYGIDGFAFASESLVGRYFGSREKANLNKVIQYSFLWGLGLALFYSGIFFLFDTEIVKVFSKDPEVLSTASGQKYWMIALPIMAFACYIWDGIYIGLTEVKMMMYAMILSLFLYVLILFGNFGNSPNIIWIALILFLLIRGLIQTFLWWTHIKRRTYNYIE